MQNAVAASLEAALAAAPDFQARVYARLFASHPELEALFGQKPDPNVKGEMLARAVDALTDLVDGDVYGSQMVSAEAVNHEGFAIAPDVFVVFFDVLRATTRDALQDPSRRGPEDARWTPATDRAWTQALASIRARLSLGP